MQGMTTEGMYVHRKCPKTLKKHSLWHSEPGTRKYSKNTPWNTFGPGPLSTPVKWRPGSQNILGSYSCKFLRPNGICALCFPALRIAFVCSLRPSALLALRIAKHKPMSNKRWHQIHGDPNRNRISKQYAQQCFLWPCPVAVNGWYKNFADGF